MAPWQLTWTPTQSQDGWVALIEPDHGVKSIKVNFFTRIET